MGLFSKIFESYISRAYRTQYNPNSSSNLSDVNFESFGVSTFYQKICFYLDEEFFKKVDSNGDTALTYLIVELIKSSNSQSFKTDLKLFNNSKYRYLLDIPNSFGETPLHVAVITNNKSFTEILVKANANVGIKDNRNLTPLDIAIMLDYQDIIKILETSETAKKSDIQSNIYNWGEIITSEFSLKSESKPIKILFNDELCSPVSIEYGQNFSLILTDTGAVYSSGLCSYGKTGQKNKRDILIPTQIKSLENKRIKSISCGSHHSLALDDLGLVYSWGNGSNGRLGLEAHILGEKKIVSTPTLISMIPTTNILDQVITQISAGSDNSFLIASNGSVYSFGSAISEKLGYEELVLGYQALPRKIESIPPMKQVSASNLHTVLLDRDGNVYTFGSTTNGRLGRPSIGKDYKPTMIDFSGELVIKKIATGTNFTVALSESGELFGWGGNSNGQLGVEPICGVSESFETPILIKCLSNLGGIGKINIHDLAVGSQHVVILSDEGEVFCFGDNRKGQCGVGLSFPGYDGISLTQFQSTQIGRVFKVYAGGNNTMISLSSDHHVFGEELLKLLNSNLFSDIKLKVNGSNQTIINAHKIILAARCKKLDSLIRLQLKNPLQPQSIKINDSDDNETKAISSEIIDNIIHITIPTSLQILNLFLKYLYSDHVNLTTSILHELGELSHCLGVGRLSSLCNYNNNNISLQKLPISTLLEDLKKIQNQDFVNIYSDVQFNCISNVDSSENGFIKSYKLFSYLGSSYFKSMLGGSFIESEQKEIQLNETSVLSLRSLLNYCYCEEIPDDINECVELLIISDIHSIHRAKDLAASKIRSLMDNDSICYIYHISKLYNVKPLSIWCLAQLKSISITNENLKKLPYFTQLPNELKLEISDLKNK
ncbi:hypothetical protein RB653_006071 [Dictyostelium firmibasis]|uniref:BTB domain-containing protein n=1 Tax=Dictyostelium firmibasis TaxID=79012 RepID=A0AAN7UDU3_9MYCE